MGKYREYSDQDVINAAKEVHSLSGLLRKLNLRVAGGNFENMKRILCKLKVDTSHWTGRAWNKDQQLKDWSQYSRPKNLKKHLISKKGHKCEECDLTQWRGQDIILEVHHKDGDRTNNEFENLQLLCCNCHALTDNWRNKKRARGEIG